MLVDYFFKFLVSLLPVFVFLGLLIVLDSYKLLKLTSVLTAVLVGCLSAVIASFINHWIINTFELEFIYYTRYGAPIVEEIIKGISIIYLVKSQKIGFMVDAAIYGFGIGAGFALLENIYYLQSILEADLYVWVIRGFGTAVMHGGTTATFAIISDVVSDRKASEKLQVFLPGLSIAIIFHSFYNHFFLSPIIYTLILLLTLPMATGVIFKRSEKYLKEWLGVGFDTDMELLKIITEGKISDTNVGKYIQSIKSKFSGEVVVDMICLLRIYLELSIRAKGILMMHEAGMKIEPDPEVHEKFNEMKFLEKSIGKTGMLAISPFLHKSGEDLWQLHMLEREEG